ncbi:HDOD domain-containing protein [bacterium]|nr:HDOD domain-containing protein [bacterium]
MMDPQANSDDLSLVNDLRKRVLLKLEELEDLPTLPAVVMKVLDLATKDNVSVRDLKQVIITDPPLSAKVLKVANSVYYGRASKTNSLDMALVTIGLDMLVTICTSMGVIHSFDAWEERHLQRKDIWAHALATGFLAKSLELRKAMTAKSGPDIFVAGLLHNIGWIVMDEYFGEELDAILKTAEEVGEWGLDYERDILGMDHTELGYHFLLKWGIPEEVAEVVRYHHDPDYTGTFAAQSALIGLASSISPHPFVLDVPLKKLSDQIPHRLSNTEGVQLQAEMKQRYAPHISQAEAMTERLLDWM